MHRQFIGIGVSLALLAFAVIGRAETITYDYTTLTYTDDAGTSYITNLTGVSGNLVVGSYVTDASTSGDPENGIGSNGLLYNISTGQWSAIEWPNSTLNRTEINGIDGETYVGAFATIWPDPKQHDISAWLGAYGFVGGQNFITDVKDPNVDEHKETEGTYLKGISLTGETSGTVVGWWVDDSGYSHGFVSEFTDTTFGEFVPVDGVPNDVEVVTIDGASVTRIVGYIGATNIEGDYTVGTYIVGSTMMTLQAPWAVNPDNSGQFFSTIATGISGDWITGYWTDVWANAHGFLYNIVSEEWYQVNDVPGAESTYITGIDGNTIVGSWTMTTGTGDEAVNGFIGTTTAVPEPSTTAFFLVAACVMICALRRRRSAAAR